MTHQRTLTLIIAASAAIGTAKPARAQVEVRIPPQAAAAQDAAQGDNGAALTAAHPIFSRIESPEKADKNKAPYKSKLPNGIMESPKDNPLYGVAERLAILRPEGTNILFTYKANKEGDIEQHVPDKAWKVSSATLTKNADGSYDLVADVAPAKESDIKQFAIETGTTVLGALKTASELPNNKAEKNVVSRNNKIVDWQEEDGVPTEVTVAQPQLHSQLFNALPQEKLRGAIVTDVKVKNEGGKFVLTAKAFKPVELRTLMACWVRSAATSVEFLPQSALKDVVPVSCVFVLRQTVTRDYTQSNILEDNASAILLHGAAQRQAQR